MFSPTAHSSVGFAGAGAGCTAGQWRAQRRARTGRQGQGAGSPSGRQAQALLQDQQYDGFFLRSEGCPPANASCGALPKGTRVGPFDFRNETLVQFFIEEYVGGESALGNPHIDGGSLKKCTCIQSRNKMPWCAEPRGAHTEESCLSPPHTQACIWTT